MAWLIGNDLKNDWLIGTSANDTIKGYGGNDTLKGGGGADYINGGAGIDTAMYVDSVGGVYVDLWTGRGQYGTAQGDTLVSIENLYGSSYGDMLYGNDVANELRGLDGDDDLLGRGGADFLDGGWGDDLLIGGSGPDTMIGGEGYDRAAYAASPAGVFVSLEYGIGFVGDADGDTLSGIEGLEGSAYDDGLTGDANANHLLGYGGNDWLYGRGGDDALMGGEGYDHLEGEDGNDHLYGEGGEDWLEGGAGVDVMNGGANGDLFVWSAITDTSNTVSTADYVFGFNYWEGDHLSVSQIDADTTTWGDQAFTFIGSAAFSGTPGEINYVYQNGQTIIQMQTDSSPEVDAMIRLDGIVTPTASWFYL